MLETDRLFIIEAAEEDINRIMELESHKDNRDFIWQGTYEEHKVEIEDRNHLLLVFRRKEDSFIVGFALIRLDFKSEVLELRRIAISHKGVGYGREVMKALFKHAFEELNINRLWLDVYPENDKGIKLYEGMGMYREGILRQSYKSDKGFRDQIIYSILRSEYLERKLNKLLSK